MNNMGLIIGILAGLGLGLLLGSEFAGSTITIIGAMVLVITLIAMAFLSLKKKI